MDIAINRNNKIKGNRNAVDKGLNTLRPMNVYEIISGEYPKRESNR